MTTLTPVAAAAYEYMTLLRTEYKDKPKPAEKGATPLGGNATPTEEVVPSPDGRTRRRRKRQTVEDPTVVSTLAPSTEEPPALPPTTKTPEVLAPPMTTAPPTTPRPTMAATPSVDEVFDECVLPRMSGKLFPSRFGRDCYRMEEVAKYVTDKEVWYDIKIKYRRRGGLWYNMIGFGPFHPCVVRSLTFNDKFFKTVD